ncbi:hypothetical protein COT72_05660 [archaeon CG10_big_fil_rev_8_21_14_0_10_43_11]|nr:MAG: hypothetical protein COT72_05660 [archaeon CG10_big_fil_rev_8_21_14_0_10_43_11]
MSLEGLFAIILILVIITIAFATLDDKTFLLYKQQRAEYLQSVCNRLNFALDNVGKHNNTTFVMEFSQPFNLSAQPSARIMFISREQDEIGCLNVYNSYSNSSVITSFNLSVTFNLSLASTNGVVIFS